MIFVLALGMTIKFFPIFFLSVVKVSPVWVMAISVIVPVVMSALVLKDPCRSAAAVSS